MNREIKFKAWIKGKKEMDMFAHNRAYFGPRCENPSYDEQVIMQYTGIHDKNGKEIWEGDVISYDLMDRPNEYIEFKEGAFQVSGTPSHINMARHGKVIGNVYQNPELIK